jgi:hypothetical protein
MLEMSLRALGAEASVLLCLWSTLVAHDIYSNLRHRDVNLCCNGRDCRPVEATVWPDRNRPPASELPCIGRLENLSAEQPKTTATAPDCTA